nr:hypothetical protein BaRGS_001669 [Batillaria attramentaria]
MTSGSAGSTTATVIDLAPEVSEKVANIQRELAVEKATLSKRIRELTSVADNRPSAVATGTLGMVMLLGLLGLLVLLDLLKVVRFCGVWRKHGHREEEEKEKEEKEETVE